MKDRFSGYASQYAAFRPRYPQALYDFVFQHVQFFDLAWDVGTGNGQAASILAKKFTKVLATDISPKQLANAIKAENITYEVAGEKTTLPDHSVDLITVAQAVHWFDRDTFYWELRRVGKPGAVVAVWGYDLLKISDSIDSIINHFYTSVVGPYWDPERKLVDQRYASMAFPFHEIEAPLFEMQFEWTLGELEGYLSTWSAVQKYVKEMEKNPVTELMKEVSQKWERTTMTIRFPIFMRIGRI